MGLVVEDDGWRIPDRVWARMEPLLPAPPAHPLGCHNPRVPDRDAMNAILLVLRTGMQWNALERDRDLFVARRRIGASGSGRRRACSSSSGGRGCSPTTPSTGSSGSGWRWTARWARRHSAASRPARIPLTELKRGETIAPHRGQGRPDRDRAGGREPERLQARSRRRSRSIPIERPEPTAERPQGLCLDGGYDYPEVQRARRRVRASPPTSAAAAKRRKRSNARPASAPAAGSSSAPTPGSTASAASSSAGRNAPTPTSPCSTSPAA